MPVSCLTSSIFQIQQSPVSSVSLSCISQSHPCSIYPPYPGQESKSCASFFLGLSECHPKALHALTIENQVVPWLLPLHSLLLLDPHHCPHIPGSLPEIPPLACPYLDGPQPRVLRLKGYDLGRVRNVEEYVETFICLQDPSCGSIRCHSVFSLFPGFPGSPPCLQDPTAHQHQPQVSLGLTRRLSLL